jgi:hypothetical protein
MKGLWNGKILPATKNRRNFMSLRLPQVESQSIAETRNSYDDTKYDDDGKAVAASSEKTYPMTANWR